MNLVFMGTPSFAVPSLDRLLSDGHTISAVVTAPERKRGRGRKVTDTAVGEYAREHDLTVLRPEDLTLPAFHEELASLAPDIIVVVAFRILPDSLFSIPGKGIFNLHASLLPRYRGAAPIQRAILNGDTETGVTTFLLQRKVDTGGMLLQEGLPIGPDETGGEVHDRLAQLGADVVSRTVSLIGTGSFSVSAQDERRVTYAPKIRKEDLMIDWDRPSKDVHNQIRAFSPEPGAWTTIDGKVLKIYRSSLVTTGEHESHPPGTIDHVASSACHVRTAAGSIAIEEVMLEGRKRMRIEEFLRGFPLTPGKALGGDGSLPGA